MKKDNLDDTIREALSFQDEEVDKVASRSKESVWASVAGPKPGHRRAHLVYGAIILLLLSLFTFKQFRGASVQVEKTNIDLKNEKLEEEILQLKTRNEEYEKLNSDLRAQLNIPEVTRTSDTIVIRESIVKIERDTLYLNTEPQIMVVRDTIYIPLPSTPEESQEELLVEVEPQVTKVQYNFKRKSGEREKTSSSKLSLKTYKN